MAHYVVKSGKSIILYMKHVFSLDDPFVQKVNEMLVEHGWKVVPFTYGSYSLDEWKASLDDAVAVIFMTTTESQGIALAEAWAMDIPTFVYEGGLSHPLIFGRRWPQVNAAPYINYTNGARWHTMEGLSNLLAELYKQPWAPRHYVLNTMTDKIAVWNTLRAIECEWRTRH